MSNEEKSDTITLKIQFPDDVNSAMVKTLNEVYQKNDWYRIDDIARRFRDNIGWTTCTSRKAGCILTQLGFKKHRRKGRSGHIHVFIDDRTLRQLE